MKMNQQKTRRELQELQENRQKRVAELVLQAQEMRLKRAQQEARKLKPVHQRQLSNWRAIGR